jgi:hypothetical protein
MIGHSWEETAQVLKSIAPICDKDGMDIYFLDENEPHKNITSHAEVEAIFNSVHPRGLALDWTVF